MGITRQLFQLQEVDLEIESDEKTLNQKESQLGDNQIIIKAQAKIAASQQRLDELKQQQHTVGWEMDDVSSKITRAEEQMYSGKITNSKELSGLQHEVNTLKANCDRLETGALELIDAAETAEAELTAENNELVKLEGEWQTQQQKLATEIDQFKTRLSDLNSKRKQLTVGIDPQTMALYEKVRKQKGQALARIEQGICLGCRISLASSQLQQARSSNPAQCSSCGRILYLP
ncbi:zinc ribbon domain-containing protein [Chloroflexota bacterium]